MHQVPLIIVVMIIISIFFELSETYGEDVYSHKDIKETGMDQSADIG